MKLCTNPRVSTLDILGLLDCLLGSLEQSALTRAKATLLRKWQTNKRRDKSSQTQVVNMSMTEPSLLYKMTLDDRIRGRIKFPRQRKKPTCSISQELCSFYEKTCCQKRPAGAERGETRPKLQAKKRLNPKEVQWQKGKRQTKARARANNKTHLPKARVKGRFRAKAHNGKTSPSQERARQSTTQGRFHRWTSRNARHKFRGRQLPEPSHLSQSIRDIVHKFKWWDAWPE